MTKEWPADKVERRPIDSLLPYAKNSRTHDEAQIAAIASSIKEWGWTAPCLIDESGTLIAGHGRVLAARQLGIKDVPVMIATGWTEAQRRAYVIADNKLSERAGWDYDMLSLELSELRELDFDLGKIGFDDAELDSLLAEKTEGLTDPDETPEPPVNPVSRLGDVWMLGRHRLACGDCTDADTVDRVLNGVMPHLMVTDPPYGVEYTPDWRSGLDAVKRATGEVQNDARADWREAYALFPGDVAYVWHAGIYSAVVADGLSECGFALRSQIIWVKPHFALGRGDYHWQHEPCWYAVKGKGHWAGDRKQTTIWQIANGTFQGGKAKAEDAKTGHGTQKPVECMKRPIENNSSPGQAVYEPFSGSFSTGIACEMTGRSCHAVEINPQYVDVGILRWQKFVGKEAVLESTGQTFAEVCENRYAGGEWAQNCAGSYDDAVAAAHDARKGGP